MQLSVQDYMQTDLLAGDFDSPGLLSVDEQPGSYSQMELKALDEFLREFQEEDDQVELESYFFVDGQELDN